MVINRVEIGGYLARKPELRYLPSGTPVANGRLGQTYRYQDSNQQQKEHTNWHNLSFYGDLSKVALSFEKGDNIYIEGTIEQRQFTPKDGSQRTVNEIVVRYCHLIAPSRFAAAATAVTEQRIPPSVNDHSDPDREGASTDDSWPVR